MYYSDAIRDFFIMMTVIVLGSICFIKIGTVDMHSLCATAIILVPAIVIMGCLGQAIGNIIDNPKNRADADYKLSVLNALKKMDKSITLQELNEKLSKQAEEKDLPDTKDDVDE